MIPGEEVAMALMPDALRFSPEEWAQLAAIKAAAVRRHERARTAAARRGRRDFPDLPYECSWAFEEEFRREVRR